MGFQKRTSKLSPEIFFDLLLYCSSRAANSSLSFQVSYLKDYYGVSIKKQSLDERFSDRCVDFVKAVLSRMLEDKLKNVYTIDFLESFNTVRIKDSTRFIAPHNLRFDFKGCGGSGDISLAGICIQFEYDLKSGRILDLSIYPSNRTDSRDAAETIDTVEASDLIIRDLGYYSLSAFQQINEKKAFFLSRLNMNTKAYKKAENKLCFKTCYRQMKQQNMTQMELEVCLGEKERLPVRLILILVPDEVYAKRIAERKKRNKKGVGIAEETKSRYRFNLLITNIGQQTLSCRQLYICYKLRWQVELIFKSWKSTFNIHGIHSMKKERYLCLLYARLLLIVINLQLIYQIQKQNCFYDDKQRVWIISINKALKTLSCMFDVLHQLLRKEKEEAERALARIYNRLSEDHWYEYKKWKMNFPEIIQLLF